jgi:hypothetical protein
MTFAVLVPYWLLVALFVLAPLRCMLIQRRRRSLPSAACANCGYDLRARPDQ